MFGIRMLKVGVIVFACGLWPASSAHAGPILDWLGLGDNPPSSYSPMRHGQPNVARVNDHIHGPKLNVYSPDRHPEVPPTSAIIRYPSAIASPADTIYERPVPPPTSGAR